MCICMRVCNCVCMCVYLFPQHFFLCMLWDGECALPPVQALQHTLQSSIEVKDRAYSESSDVVATVNMTLCTNQSIWLSTQSKVM
jgi:hypothetical protein